MSLALTEVMTMPDGGVAVKVKCRCGWERILTPSDTKLGLSLGGTAGQLAATHDARCGRSLDDDCFSWGDAGE